MDIQIKDMKLVFTLTGNTLTRVVEDLDGNIIWSNGGEYYDDTMPYSLLNDYEIQMKQMSFWNIVEVVKNI